MTTTNNHLSYQQYLQYNPTMTSPLQNVFPIPVDYSYSLDKSPSAPFQYNWNAQQPMEGVLLDRGFEIGTSLSEMFDIEKNGMTPPVRKKRKRCELENDKDISMVKLKREQLLKVSSTEFERFIAKLNLGRELSKYEEKEIKRQRRLIKNREYAQEARKKKKQYLKDMESKVEELTEENAELNEKIEVLESEVEYLRNRVAELERIHESASASEDSSLTDYSITEPTFNPTSGMMDLDLDPIGWSYDSFGTGLFMMVILFSFGLFFNLQFVGLESPVSVQQSPFSAIPENTIPLDSTPWKGPRKLSAVSPNIARRISSNSLASPSEMKYTVSDIYKDEARDLSQKTCPVHKYLYPQNILCVY